LLSPQADRWAHTRAVAERSKLVAADLPRDEQDVLVAAAYLHDIGYAPELHKTGFHALDGALHFQELGYQRIANLVANHSAGKVEADERGLVVELEQFPDDDLELSMALTYCDMTSAGDGRTVTIDERLADVEDRYGTSGPVPEAAREAARIARKFESRQQD